MASACTSSHDRTSVECAQVAMSARAVKSPGDGAGSHTEKHSTCMSVDGLLPAFSAERVRDGAVPTQNTQHLSVDGLLSAFSAERERWSSSHTEHTAHLVCCLPSLQKE